jgi:hypothetical protein
MLLVAKQQLAYADFIAQYPVIARRGDFNQKSPIDLFYGRVCSLSAQDSLLLIDSLVNKDIRVRSFWNWAGFVIARGNELQALTDEFDESGLKNIRDQVIAHQDSNNGNNNFIDNKRPSGFEPELIKKIENFLQKLIDEFYIYTNMKTPVYSPDYFSVNNVRKEIDVVMSIAKPTLTD